MRLMVLLMLCAALSSCATATRLNTGNGVIYRIECDGTAVPLSACYAKANKVCANGWNQLAADGSVIPQAIIVGEIGQAGSLEKKSITVQCR